MSMKKINKSVLFFSTIPVLLGLLVTALIQKFHPIFLQKSVYFCEQTFHNVSLQIPPQVEVVTTIALIGFIAVSGLKTLAFLLQSLKLQSILKTQGDSSPLFNKLTKELSLEQKVILVSYSEPFAFCFGIRHPKIYISTNMLSLMKKEEIKAILLHEKYHLDSNDSVTVVIASLTQLFFPFFPLLSDFLHNYKVNREITADRNVLRITGSADALISVLRKLLKTPAPAFAPVAAIADYETLEPRIFALTKKTSPKWRFGIGKIILSVISIGILSATLLTPVEAVHMSTDKMDMTMVCLHNSDCMNWCKAHHTILPVSSEQMHKQNASYPYTPAM